MNRFTNILLMIVLTSILFGCGQTTEKNGKSFSITPLENMEISTGTGEKPQSKAWIHDSIWWVILPNQTGTKLWKLENNIWINKLHISNSTFIKADVKAIGNLAHLLLYMGTESELVTLEYDMANKVYKPWTKQPKPTKIQLENHGETATLDLDGNSRMWLASDDENEIHVRWSDTPYLEWSETISLAKDISSDDICVITSFPNGNIGVLWSNQNAKRFGFRLHKKGANPELWSEDEIPASSSAIPLKAGMADDHLNLAVASDGTLYASVKTSYDSIPYPLIALLVRQISGEWDELYYVDDRGTRPIVLLNEKEDKLMVFYTSHTDSAIVCKTSETSKISFGPRQTILIGESKINNVSSTKQNINTELIILASELNTLKGGLIKWP